MTRRSKQCKEKHMLLYILKRIALFTVSDFITVTKQIPYIQETHDDYFSGS